VTDATEVAADVVTGAVVAAAVEPRAGNAPPADSAETHAAAACLNCGASLTGAYCAACGQAAHIHRSFVSLGHDILHGVFHFDTKLWRTLPELVLHPGRLTRRYIDGERAKFISPMALYLLSVFLMYAVFSFTGGAAPTVDPAAWRGQFQIDNRAEIESTRQRIAEIEAQLAAPDLAAGRRVELESQLPGLRASLDVLEAIGRGDWADVERIQEFVQDEIEREQERGAVRQGEPAPTDGAAAGGSSSDEGRLVRAIREVNDNPALTAYKLKTNGYKFSWALVPLSIPFVWLLFFWRRDIRAYDHAVFVTYSISFMLLLLIFASLLGLAGVGSGYVALLLLAVPPLHMYKQLRQTYRLSRAGAVVRLLFLLFAALTALSLYVSLLVVIGALE
jgi:hypothetical protein